MMQIMNNEDGQRQTVTGGKTNYDKTRIIHVNQ